VAVAVFLAGDLGGGDFFEQGCGAAHDFFRREGQAGHARLQVLDVVVQAVGQGVEAVGGVFGEQAVLDTVKAGEVVGLHAFFVVVDPRVDGRVEVAEQLGDRFDGFIVHTGRRIQLLGGGQVAFFHRVGERLGLGRQLSDLFGDVDLVVRHRAYQVQRRRGGEGRQGREGD